MLIEFMICVEQFITLLALQNFVVGRALNMQVQILCYGGYFVALWTLIIIFIYWGIIWIFLISIYYQCPFFHRFSISCLKTKIIIVYIPGCILYCDGGQVDHDFIEFYKDSPRKLIFFAILVFRNKINNIFSDTTCFAFNSAWKSSLDPPLSRCHSIHNLKMLRSCSI